MLGTQFSDCAPPNVVIGLSGRQGAWIDQLKVECGTLVAKEDRSTSPYGYSVQVKQGPALPAHGADGGTEFMQLCPTDTALTGIRAATAAVDGTLSGLQFTCSKLL